MERLYLVQSKTQKSLQRKIAEKIAEADALSHLIPAVIIVHRCSSYRVEYMSPAGLEILGVTLDELKDMEIEYYSRFFNKEDAADYTPKVIQLMEQARDNEWISFFQQVRSSENDEWSWYTSCTKVLLRDDEHNPVLIITLAIPIDEERHLTSKVSRLTEEKLFLKRHFHEFSRLTKREREILKLMALGKTATETAELLYISPATAETHRRNVRQKLNIESSYEVSQYARAFDLI